MAPPAGSVKRQTFDPESAQKALVNMIIIDELPFSAVEHDEIKKVMETEFPDFQIPSGETISRVCAQLFMDEKLKLKSVIKATRARVCISLDTWTSTQSVKYLCITAHFIDSKWNLHKKIIGFSPICSDNGEEIGQVVEKCLHDWEINNVLTISAGNASSYDAAISYLGTRLVDTVLDGKVLRLKCFVQLTNSMVKGVLKDYEEPIAHVRAAVRYVSQSPDRIRMFKRCARECGVVCKSIVPLDCPSRWTSTFEMLYVFEKFESVFTLFGRKDPMYQHDLSNNLGDRFYVDSQKVTNVIYFLHVFYQSHGKMLASPVTSNMFLEEIFLIDHHLDNWGKTCANSEKRFFKALELKWNYTAYWGDVEDSNMLIYMASILDPRRKTNCMELYFLNSKYKHEYTDEGGPLWKKKAEFVVSATYELFNVYASKIGASHQTANFQTCGYMSYLYHDTAPRGLGQKLEIGFGGNAERPTEIDTYLSEDEYFRNHEGFDVLLWWKVNSGKYPVLSKMAKDVLAIPISAVALESDINFDGNMLDAFRGSLSPPMVEALVCTQDWITKSKNKTKVEKASSSTKLADKFLKGIYEQLEGATGGCR